MIVEVADPREVVVRLQPVLEQSDAKPPGGGPDRRLRVFRNLHHPFSPRNWAVGRRIESRR